MEIYKVVKRLVGPINPVGETHTDEDRYKNLKSLCEIIDALIDDVWEVERNNKERHEYSMQRAGKHAETFLNNLKG